MQIFFRTIIIFLFIFSIVSFFAVSIHASPAHAQLNVCNAYNSYNSIPSGFGAAYDVFATNKEMLMNSTDCTSTGFNALIGHAGKTPQNFAVYKKGYVWNGSSWFEILYTPNGGSTETNYVMGNANFSARQKYYGLNTFYVAFTCSKMNNAWKCGCRDQTCSQSYWQIQAAKKGYDIAFNEGGGGNTTNTNNDSNTNVGTGGYVAGSGAPLRVSTDGHGLLNRNGEPFLWAGDTQWKINARNNAEVTSILDDRKQKGFTVIQVMMTTNWDNGNDWRVKDAEGNMPYHNNNPLSLNEAYFARWHYIINEAKKRGLLIAMVFGEAGRGENPWKLNSISEAYEHGLLVGNIFAQHDNMVFINGQDFAGSGGIGVAGWRALAEGLVDGITGSSAHDGNANWESVFMLYHPPGVNSSSNWFHSDAWLDANGYQCWSEPDKIWQLATLDRKITPYKPTINLEGSYEDGPEYSVTITPRVVRQQAYHAYFGGAAGHTYGQNCNWNLCTPALHSGGAQGLAHLFTWLKKHAWYTFVPNQNIIIEGENNGALKKTAVNANNNKAYYIYFPENSGARIRFVNAGVGSLAASWFNPMTGETVNDRTYQTSEEPWMTPPNGWEDAVLMFE